MKKFLFSLIITVFASITLTAGPVDKSTAAQIASRFLSDEVVLISDGSDGLYIFNAADGNGWVIVSAEDSAMPILAYSDNGSFRTDRQPDNLRAWIGGYSRELQKASQQRIAQSSEVKSLWKTAGYRTKSAEGKYLETPAYDQESPYNLECPEVKESRKTYRALTGCVATAMAEVIRYHEWPEKGTGTIGGYSYKSDYNQTVNISSFSINSHSYDYTLMPFSYSGSETTAQKNAIAQLMYDCGVMVEAAYNYGTGTGAYSENIVSALSEHMGYSASAQHIYRQAYTDAEWTKLIQKEINEGRPIIYSGVDSEGGGHQFVCDGYDTMDYIHINWGWSEDANGYFTLNLKIPDQYTFSEDQTMIVGLEPDKSGSTKAEAHLMFEYYDDKHLGMSIASGSVLSKSFSINAGYILNAAYSLFGSDYVTIATYNGAVKAALLDYEGNLKEYISAEDAINGIGGAEMFLIEKLDCKISGDVSFSDRVVLMYKTSDGLWKQIKGKDGLKYNERTETYSYVKMNSAIPATDIAYILIPKGLKAGDTLYFELLAGSSPISSISWYYDEVKQSGITANLTAGKHSLRAEVTFSDGSSESISTEFTIK